MTPKASGGRPAAAKPAEEEKGASPLELARFSLRAARKHALLCVVVFVASAALGVAGVLGIPALYECTAKIYATQNSLITAALASGRRADDANSVRGLNETVFNRENLLAVVREAKLVERWDRTRTWPLRLKDQVMAAVAGEPSRRDKERALVELLTRSVFVSPEDSASIRFRVMWRDAEGAYDITRLAQRNFLTARATEEAAGIKRAIGLLEGELARADALIEPAIREVQRVVEKSRKADVARATTPRRGRAVVARAPVAAEPPKEPPLEITVKLQELRQRERALVEPWQRRNADLRFQLTELRTMYGPEHPLVIQQEAKVAAAAAEPPELAPLRREQAELLARVETLGTEGSPTSAARRVTAAGVGASALSALRELERGPEDPEIATARARLEAAIAKTRELSSRLDTARIELTTSEAGFKYRYAVVEAAEVPRKPIKPKRPVLYAIALGVAVLLGYMAGALRELITGRLNEPWQVRSLGLDILAEVELPHADSRK